MKLKFKVQTAPQDKHVSNRTDHALPSSLTFVTVDRPMQIKTAIVVPTSLPHCIPSYWGEVKVCINFQRLFWSMDMVSEGLLALAVVDSSRKFRERLDKTIENTLQRNYAPHQAESMDEMKQYTESLSLVRQSIAAPESQVSRHAIIGTIICLAVFDMNVRNRERWTMHMKGLDRLVQLSGGVETLDSCSPVRQSLFM
ncbi:uncharacterized protein DNG_04531 [Cephalotrichum gorgonifer]|uniref:Uncharacterized protein n=1 Tax=Cephalotrichum gorgonifer TaxID=2041049 RepID=A0AAE8SUM4_9PEZI|nr:uncharacterized protein DNG_04531 [Cephalotrichum gorgonifer]